MSKDWWFIREEQIGEELAAKQIWRHEAVDAWVRMGIDRDKAEEMADIAEGKV